MWQTTEQNELANLIITERVRRSTRRLPGGDSQIEVRWKFAKERDGVGPRWP